MAMQHAATPAGAEARYRHFHCCGFQKAILRFYKILAHTVHQCQLSLYARLHEGLVIISEKCSAHLSDCTVCLWLSSSQEAGLHAFCINTNLHGAQQGTY